MADNFCIMPFVHAFVTPNKVSPCCAYVGSLRVNSKEQYWHSEQLNKIRENFINNKQDKGCWDCWDKEKRGFSSLRQHSNEIYKKHIPEVKQGKRYDTPFYLDLRLGNLCNLKCRMCVSEWSSQIADEILKHPDEDWGTDKPDKKLIELDDDTWKTMEKWIPFVRRVFMTGGEPTIIKKNMDYIKKIVDSGHSKDIELIFTTNATNVNKEFLQVIGDFDKVHFSVSIDGIGDLAHYIRFPSDWSKVKENLYTIGQNHVGVALNTTVQWLNMTRLDEMFKFIEEYVDSKPKQFAGVWFQLVQHPQYLDPIFAPRFMKEKAIADIENYLNTSTLLNDEKSNDILYGEFKRSLIQTKTFLHDNIDNEKHVEEFLARMSTLDRVRGQKLFDVLPELRQLGG
jgi:sulfatase maturation enzyme AslB (radical SAM superfamily)